MKILYKLVSLISGKLASRLGKAVFRGLWSRVDSSEPPAATTAEASMPKVVGAAALEAGTMAGVAAAVNRATATVFHHLFGVWPGDQPSAGDKPTPGEKPAKR
jgi:hypothetical protein